MSPLSGILDPSLNAIELNSGGFRISLTRGGATPII